MPSFLKKLFVAIVFTGLLGAQDLFAIGKLQGYVSQGGQTVSTSLFTSSTKVQRSYPNATVTVYLAGTVTTATLYSAADLTPKANPFTASATGLWEFYAADGDYDVKFSDCSPTSCGLTSPFTLSGLRIAGNGTTIACASNADITTILQTAVNDLPSASGGMVTLSSGNCIVTDTITVADNKITIKGSGFQSTLINFLPTSGGKPVFTYSSGASVNESCALMDLGILSTDTTYQKIGIRLEDTSKFRLENIAISSQFHGPGLLGAGTSIGLQVRGRELGIVKNLMISSDQPISIESNPNTAQILDLDLWHFEDIYTLATGANPHWKFASGIQVTNLTLDGANIGTDNGLGLGTGTGDYWNWVDGSPAPAATSLGIFVRNARLEGAVGGTAYAFNIQKATGTLLNVIFEGCSTGSLALNNGWYLRGVNFVTFLNSYYTGTAEAINADGTNDAIRFINTHFLGGSTMTMTGLRQQFAYGRTEDSLRPLWADELWVKAANYGVIMNGSTFQSFVFEISNDTGTIKHRVFGSGSDTAALGAYSIKLPGVSATAVASPLVAAGVPFSVGGGIDSTNTSRFIFNTAAQVNTDDFGIATVELNTSTTAVVVRPQNISTNVNGVTLNRFGLVFTNAATGAAFNLDTGSLGAGTLVRVKVVALIK